MRDDGVLWVMLVEGLASYIGGLKIVSEAYFCRIFSAIWSFTVQMVNKLMLCNGEVKFYAFGRVSGLLCAYII